MDQPTKQQQYLARKLIDNGVTVILGHHAHVVQGIEEYKKGLIFYNLGNFIFDLPYQKTEKSYIASVELKREGVESYELRPVVINQDYIPVYMTGYPKTNFLQSIQKLSNKILSAELGDEITLEAVSKKEYNKFRYLCYKYFLRNWNRYPINYFIQSITRAILRRLHIVKNP